MKINRLTLFILFALSVIIYLFGFLFSYDYLITDLLSSDNRFSAIRSLAEYGIMYISFILFCSYLFKNKYLKYLSYIFILLIGVNSFISYCCYFIYGSGFNIGMAVSVLDSNLDEARNMVSGYLEPLAIALFLIILNIVIVHRFSSFSFGKGTKLLMFLWFILPGVFLLKHQFIGSKSGGSLIKNTFYHFKDFKAAYDLQQRMNGIKDHVITYAYKKEAEGVETIVLLIGESGRKQNMSLYGYIRNTTPNQLIEKDNMYLFKEANSPAGITNLSLPLTLSKIAPENFDNHSEEIADNVINLANQYGYHTTWISTQNNIKGVTEIASFASDKSWVNGYDLEILLKLKEALNKKGKKLIVLHINGSHPNPCLRYPANEAYFDKGTPLDCYDNSIRYTDQLIGNIFKELKGKNSAFIYFTDHGLKLNGDKLIHGDSKESTKVPFYVWFGNKQERKSFRFNKSEEDKVSISYLYPLVMKLIGLEEISLDKVENNKYFLLDHTTIIYDSLNE